MTATLRVPAATLPPTVVETFVWSIQQPGEEVLAVAHRDDALRKAVILIDKVDLLVDAEPGSRPNVHFVSVMWRQVSQAHASRTRHVDLRFGPQQPL